MKVPKLDGEMTWSIFKCMFTLCLIAFLLLGGLFGYYVHKSFNGTSMEVMQDGTNNNQSVTNG